MTVIFFVGLHFRAEEIFAAASSCVSCVTLCKAFYHKYCSVGPGVEEWGGGKHEAHQGGSSEGRSRMQALKARQHS